MGRIKDAFKKMASLGRGKGGSGSYHLHVDGYAGARPSPVITALMPPGLREIRDARKGWRLRSHTSSGSVAVHHARPSKKAHRKMVQASRRANRS